MALAMFLAEVVKESAFPVCARRIYFFLVYTQILHLFTKVILMHTYVVYALSQFYF